MKIGINILRIENFNNKAALVLLMENTRTALVPYRIAGILILTVNSWSLLTKSKNP
jgi:hypothetical protein